MRYPFLALLARGPAHGYELKQALEERFGTTLAPLNAGQVYTTLARLERDGLVRGDDAPAGGRPRRVYELTDAGRSALADWVGALAAPTRLRDDFFLKLVLAGATGLADRRGLLERQRRAYLQALRDLAPATRSDNAAAALLAEGAVLHLEADLRWLELCERRLLSKEAE